jgi:hypothetical protein
MFHKQPKSLLRRVLKGFSASNYCIAPRLWQPDFCWDHTGVPLAFLDDADDVRGLVRWDQAVNSADAPAGVFLPARFWFSDVSPLA